MKYKKEIIPTLAKKESVLISKICDGRHVYKDIEFKVTGEMVGDSFQIIGATEKNKRYESCIMLPKRGKISFNKKSILIDYGRVKLIIKY